MSIKLNEQQQKELDSVHGTPALVIDPRTNFEYVLVPASDYYAVSEALEDERTQKAIRKVGLRNAAARIEESP
jgi:hypothetical protein